MGYTSGGANPSSLLGIAHYFVSKEFDRQFSPNSSFFPHLGLGNCITLNFAHVPLKGLLNLESVQTQSTDFNRVCRLGTYCKKIPGQLADTAVLHSIFELQNKKLDITQFKADSLKQSKLYHLPVI